MYSRNHWTVRPNPSATDTCGSYHRASRDDGGGVSVLSGGDPLALGNYGVLRVPGAGHPGVEDAEAGEQRACGQ
jgi:hypothetical protein